ncbi:Spy0128 family protein [Pseudoscardovia radai]|uniref:Spy0128 family protein n=1 Tax=Pseudoscardovia radai TaxID=987066 RepID=UPI0039946737
MSGVPGVHDTSGASGVARRASVAVCARKIVAAIVVTLFVCIPLVAVSPMGVHPAYAADSSVDASDNGMAITLFDYSDQRSYRRGWGWGYSLTKPSINDNGHALLFGDHSGTDKQWNGVITDTDCLDHSSGRDYDWNCATGGPVYAGIVENALGSDGYPTLDPDVTGSTESLAYLFGGASDVAVTSYPVAGGFLKRGTDGYYRFDSGTQDARYDPSTQRMTLTDIPAGGSSRVREFTPLDNVAPHSSYQARGMSMSGGFYMPDGGKTDGEDMIFDFSGDDDVWVFVDGVLALDMGGIRGGSSSERRGGTIDFTTGAITYDQPDADWWAVSHATTLSEAFSRVDKTWDSAPYARHTVSLFYLERDERGSQCSLRFNMPILPAGTVEIAENVTFGEAVPVDGTRFGFAAFIDYNPDASTAFERFTGSYDVIDASGATVSSGVSAADGTIWLANGQTARLTGPPGHIIQTTSRYYVTELADPAAAYSATVQGVAMTHDAMGWTSPTYAVGDVSHLRIDNAVTSANMFDATLEQECVDCPSDARFTLLALVGSTPFSGTYDLVLPDGSTQRLMTTNGLIALGTGQKAMIRHIVGGNGVTVREVNSDGSAFDDGSYLAPTYAMAGGALDGAASAPADGGVTGTAKRAPSLAAGDALSVVVTNVVTNRAKAVPITNFPTVRVTVSGDKGWAAGDAFVLRLVPVTSSYDVDEAYGNPMPSSCSGATSANPCQITVAKDASSGPGASATGTFGRIAFSAPGLYHYRVTEVAGAGSGSSAYSYSKASYVVTVSVKAIDDASSTLETTLMAERTADDMGQERRDLVAWKINVTDASFAVLDFTNTDAVTAALPLTGSRSGLERLIIIGAMLAMALVLGVALAIMQRVAERRERDEEP